MSKLERFLAGDRLDDVALFVSDAHLDESGRIANVGESVDGGVVLVVPGDDGRRAFASGTGMDAMDFAKGAMATDGTISPRLDGGECPAAEPPTEGDHHVEFVFAFAEGRNEEVGGLYAEGDVIHAYAQCSCGESYSHKWIAGERDEDD
ncbi:MAG: DUF5807 family protein [Haloferacaceae archaeon]